MSDPTEFPHIVSMNVAEEILRLREENERLRKENFAFSAGLCPHQNGNDSCSCCGRSRYKNERGKRK